MPALAPRRSRPRPRPRSCAGAGAFGRSCRHGEPGTQIPRRGRAVSGRRYYSPGQGRFLCRDPIEEKGGRHLYAFVNNNPTNAWDYLGMVEQMAAFVVNGGRREIKQEEDSDGSLWEITYQDMSYDPAYGMEDMQEVGRRIISRARNSDPSADGDGGCGPNNAAPASITTNRSINWGQVGQGSLTLLGGVGSMIGGAFLAGTTAPTVAGAVIGVMGMVAGATSFGLGMTTIVNGFTGGNRVNTPTGSVPQGVVELAGAATGNPNLQIIGSYGDVGVSVLTPPAWGGPLATGSCLFFPPPDFDPDYYYPFDPTK